MSSTTVSLSNPMHLNAGSSIATVLQTQTATLPAATKSPLSDPLTSDRLSGRSSTALTTTAPDLSTSPAATDVPTNYTHGGSSFYTATDLGSLTNTLSVVDFAGVSDNSPNDYYRFSLDTTNNLNLALTGLSADADVQLLNSVGAVIASSTNWDSNDEAINLANLSAGNYFIRVSQYNGETGFTLNLSPNSPSDLLPNEFELGTVGPYSNVSQSGYISSSNTADVYHFSVDGEYRDGDIFGSYNSSNVSISLTGLSADADVRVLRDANYNGIIDAGDEIVRSALGGPASESIDLQGLGVGDYYIQVYQYSGSTPYTLDVSANGGSGFAQEPNNTLSDAYDTGTLNGTRIFEGWVSGRSDNGFYGGPDTSDFYRFNLGTTSNFALTLDGLSGDADVQVIRDANFNGVIDPGEVISSSTLGGSNPESINLQGLGSGDYFVRVYPYSTNATQYTLTLNAEPGLGYASEPNDSLAQAVDVQTLNGNRSFTGFVDSYDSTDFYHFQVGTTTNFNLSLTGLSADADVQLLDGSGNYIAGSFNYGSNPEAIDSTLSAGDYYVEINQYSGDTDYTLNLSA